MFPLASGASIFAYRSPCDMRKSFFTLSALVLEMNQDVFSGGIFVFVSRNRKRAKLLFHDGTGLCLLAKKIDVGTFAPLWKRDTLSNSELMLFLEGSHVVTEKILMPKKISRAKTSMSPSDFR